MSYGLHGPGPREWRDMTIIYISIEQAMLYVLSITIIQSYTHEKYVNNTRNKVDHIITRVDSDRGTYMIPCMHGIVSDALFTQHVSLYPHHKHQETGQDILYQCVPDPFISLPRQRLRLIANATYEPTGAHANCAGWMWLAASDGQKTSEADARSCCMFVLDIPDCLMLLHLRKGTVAEYLMLTS